MISARMTANIARPMCLFVMRLARFFGIPPRFKDSRMPGAAASLSLTIRVSPNPAKIARVEYKYQMYSTPAENRPSMGRSSNRLENRRYQTRP